MAAPEGTPPIERRTAAVVVDFNVGAPLHEAVRSILAEGVDDVVVVENGERGSSAAALGDLAGSVRIVRPGANIGFGAGVNRGVAALSPAVELVVVANPDTSTHAGAISALVSSLDDHPSWAIVGPTVLTPEGEPYPSARRFPSPALAAAHALGSVLAPRNRFSARYRTPVARSDGGVDWVSGSYFIVRRGAFEELGGFDEAYFMFAEDMDLCWRAHESGLGVGVEPRAAVTHLEGEARRSQPYRMLVAHHRSALRFYARTAQGPSWILLPVAALVLALRLAASLARARLDARSPSNVDKNGQV